MFNKKKYGGLAIKDVRDDDADHDDEIVCACMHMVI
jgi:hypothetical protein